MEAEQADLMSLGDHCEVPECNQIDFLPFQCDACHQVPLILTSPEVKILDWDRL